MSDRRTHPVDFLSIMQRMVAMEAMGPSAIRGQGKGVLGACQAYLSQIHLDKIPHSMEKRFRNWIDHQTEKLLDTLPAPNRPWGAARKAINLFLRDAHNNIYLHTEYKLFGIEPFLEVALDSAVSRGLRHYAGRSKLPQWPGLKHLTPKVSDAYQAVASQLAAERGMASVHLDMMLWL